MTVIGLLLLTWPPAGRAWPRAAAAATARCGAGAEGPRAATGPPAATGCGAATRS